MSLEAILPGRRGFGTAPLGNMFRAIPEDRSQRHLGGGLGPGHPLLRRRPFYGAGLAESRLGTLLSTKPRDSYVLSTKVGRVILDEVQVGTRELGDKGGLFEHGRPNQMVNEWTAAATERSIEDSLKRPGVDRLDIRVHDIAQDFNGDEWLRKFEEAPRAPSGCCPGCATKG